MNADEADGLIEAIKRLLQAILDDCFRVLRTSKNPTRLRLEVDWLMCEDEHRLCDFVAICRVLNLDPQRVRERALAIGTLPAWMVPSPDAGRLAWLDQWDDGDWWKGTPRS